MTAATTRCCIVGGGPAGMMLGFLLARSGVDVTVLEKHGDFLRDFRGDTIHPSTLEIMAELGLLDEFLKLPHTQARTLAGAFGREHFTFVDFSHLPTRCKFIALMPQWDFLNFLAQHGSRYPGFRLRMQAEAIDLIEDDGRVTGVRARTPEGTLDISADLIVGADGRHSTLRGRAGMKVDTLGAPMDVLWFRLPHHPGDPDTSMGKFEPGRIFVLIDRGDYWQCAYVIPKGTIEDIHRAGLDAFRQGVVASNPFFADRVGELKDWGEIKLLTVAVDRMPRWHRPGLLFIGDAAHAMSPIGGVGINLAVQDAVAAANILWEPLRAGQAGEDDLARVQKRREFPARVTQAIQVFLQDRVISRALAAKGELQAPLAVRLLARFPLLRRVPARLLGLGVRPEHVRTPVA
ncbi:MAG: FAD-dependent oxidoreductase [Alphaproteobacteria bacterium]|nr:MAG: FAD-dependent oxidoreductase [Alphaproteobacteria bacterium]